MARTQQYYNIYVCIKIHDMINSRLKIIIRNDDDERPRDQIIIVIITSRNLL